MTISLEERLLIDRYLEGALSGLELQKFMERLDADEAFRTAVSLQNLLIEGIVRCADNELHESLLESLNYRKSSIPLGLKLILTFFVITFSMIILWNYIGTDTSKDKRHFLTFSWLDRTDNLESPNEVQKHGKTENEHKAGQNIANQSKAQSEKEEKDDSAMEQSVLDSIDNNESNNDKNEFVVKKDQLLITQSLFVHEIISDPKKPGKKKNKIDTSLSASAADKLNPSAGLEIRNSGEKEFSQMMVEFWISPINYRGYKMHRDKLILFGIEEPDAVKLYRQDGKLYLGHLNEYYLIEPTDNFTSYQSVLEKEFSLQQTK